MQLLMLTADPDPVSVLAALRLLGHRLYSVRLGGRSLTLTYREVAQLVYLARHPGQVFTHSQLLAEVWGDDFSAVPARWTCMCGGCGRNSARDTHTSSTPCVTSATDAPRLVETATPTGSSIATARGAAWPVAELRSVLHAAGSCPFARSGCRQYG